MKDVIVLEWTFSPPDYFEETIVIERDTYTVTIAKGKAEARIDPAGYDPEHKMRDELHDALNDRFLGVQVLTHKVYELSKASMYQLHPDGRKDVTIFPESCVITMAVGTPDIVVQDKDGNTVSDSHRDRIEKKKELAHLVEKHSSQDQALASILASYSTAVNDPENELVHLYEIRDALSENFRGNNVARRTLAISNANWSRLGQLANDEQLRQGRHRGKKAGELRDATDSELKEARSIAREMIEAYLHYLEGRT